MAPLDHSLSVHWFLMCLTLTQVSFSWLKFNSALINDMGLAELGLWVPWVITVLLQAVVLNTETYSMYYQDVDYMVLQAALGLLLLHPEEVGRSRAVPSHLHGPGEVLYDGTWHATETLLWTQSSLESGCSVPALRDMKPFLSNPMKAHAFAIKAQLLHFEMYGAPGYSALDRKCPISGCHRAQDNKIKWVSCNVWDLDF